jgi:hypothetical protein
LRLYHWSNINYFQSAIIILLSVILCACTAPQVTQGLITTNIIADNKDIQIKITSGSTVQEALKTAQITLGELDKVEPPIYTVLTDGDQVKVIRVREEYFIEQEIIPFEHQELKNEALPEGEIRLSQPGVNGLEEITYHRVYEDDIEVSTNIVKSVVLHAAIPEVVMIGSRSSIESFDFPGKIAYTSAGNAWIVENSTSNRHLVVSTGDLDGRIFSISPDGKFLLYSRNLSEKNLINSLWMASLTSNPVKIIDLDINNVVHYAEVNSDSTLIAYTTAEWRETAPGWQANNDLNELRIRASGSVGSPNIILESNSGGVYGWWGMDFAWAPDEMSFLYSRPDGIGIIDEGDGLLTSIHEITPYQTGGNWAWVPGIAWSSDEKFIYTVDHELSESSGSVESHHFDLIAIPLTGGSSVKLVNDVGMFAYPVPSPVQSKENFINTTSGINLDQFAYSIAYLQAIFPDQSETSGYRLSIMDRDGSNQRSVFPEEGAVGLNPQRVLWSPEPMGTDGNYAIAFIYNGNIWMVDSTSGTALQVTGDGLTTKADWR